MNILKNSHLMYGAAALSGALVLALILPSIGLSSIALPTAAKTIDSFAPHGYVIVSAKHADGSEFYHNEEHNLITTAGKDFIAAQIGSASAATSGANYIALTNTAITPAAGDTTLSGEITTNGLGRALGTYAHTAGQNTFTVSKTFTATATQSAQAAGLFTASSSGTMMAENTFTAVTLNNGDSLTITWTITLS